MGRQLVMQLSGSSQLKLQPPPTQLKTQSAAMLAQVMLQPPLAQLALQLVASSQTTLQSPPTQVKLQSAAPRHTCVHPPPWQLAVQSLSQT
jgi:hypothetical protein